MIAKQVQGSSFCKVLNYVHDKSGARRIGSNMVGKEPLALAEEFRLVSSLRPRVTKCVYHASLSVSQNEKLSDDQWLNIARAFLKGMDFNGNQYAVYRHTDTEHEHVHIIANRIRITDGSVVNDSWQYRRGEIVVRGLEKEFNLSPTASSFNRGKTSPTTGEMRRYKRTGEVMPRSLLQRLIDEALTQNPSLEEFIDNLGEREVSVRLRKSNEGEIEGISYKLNGVAFQGGQLGKDYSWNGLKSALTNKISTQSQEKPLAVNKAIVPQTQEKPSALNKQIIPQSQEKPLGVNKPILPQSQVNKPLLPTLQAGQDELLLQKSRYRNKYAQLAEYIRKLPNFESSEPREIDRAVILLSLKYGHGLQEAKAILTQSDRVIRWGQELPREKFIEVATSYIEGVVREAQGDIDKTSLTVG
ncbi:MAG: hypothetical protein N5P05_004503 (plasmid) [Chroococcopsis gigantea SAG 12.99]|jgi:hypothetical protein|nr:hypothetical protein [Chroococcopsis gigantea SAG 12.99]